MPTPRKGARLGGSPAHQRLILSNLATALFEHGRITTTEAKARVLRPVAEKLITKARKGDLHNRREVLKTIHDKSVVHTLFTACCRGCGAERRSLAARAPPAPNLVNHLVSTARSRRTRRRRRQRRRRQQWGRIRAGCP